MESHFKKILSVCLIAAAVWVGFWLSVERKVANNSESVYSSSESSYSGVGPPIRADSLLSKRASRKERWDPPTHGYVSSIESMELSDAIKSELSMTDSEIKEVEVAVGVLFGDIQNSVKKNLKVDVLRSNERVHAFKVAPFPSEGTNALWRFRVTLERALGKQRGKVFAESFEYNNYYGWFGQRDVFISLSEQKWNDEKYLNISLEEADPVTGKVLSRRSSRWDDIVGIPYHTIIPAESFFPQEPKDNKDL